MYPLLIEPTHLEQLIVSVVYGLILALVLWISAADLACYLRGGTACFKRRFIQKVLLGTILVVTCIALLAHALFVMALAMHGPQPTLRDLLLLLATAFTPVILLIAWMAGSRIANGIMALGLGGLLLYLVFIRPDLPIRLFAENDFVWAQKWMAQAEPGKDWLRRAARNGDSEAQYQAGLKYTRTLRSNSLFRKAAEQGHTDAMIELARHGDTAEEREHWLEVAFSQRHPEALFMKAERLMDSDLTKVRELMLEAGEDGSRSAMMRLVTEYTAGGLLFDQDTKAAERWSQRLRKAMRDADMTDEYKVWQLNEDLPDLKKEGLRVATGEPDALFSKAEVLYKSHRADAVVKQRALRYFKQAALQGHGKAAYRLGRHYDLENPDPAAAKTALDWYKRGAGAGHIPAMGELARYYLGDDPAYARDLQQAVELGQRMIETIERNPEPKSDNLKWYALYHGIMQQHEKEQQQGGSLKELETAAQQDTHQKFLYGKALLGRDFAQGKALIREAAHAGEQEARFHFAQTTLRQPRTTQQEIEAITFLQQLVAEGYTPAYPILTYEFRRNTSVLPLNDYLAYRLLGQARLDPALAQAADSMAQGIPPFIADLDLDRADDTLTEIQAWYNRNRATAEDPERLAINFRNLMTHYQDAGALRAGAQRGDAEAQYRYGRYLLGRDFAQAFSWQEKAAEQGLVEAQYEIAHRLLDNKRNSPELYAKAIRYLEAAADKDYIAAKGLLAFYYSGKYDYLTKRVRPDHARARRLYREVLDSTGGEFVYTSEINGKATRYRRDRIEALLAELE